MEQVNTDTPQLSEEETYEELYNKGFDDKNTESEPKDDIIDEDENEKVDEIEQLEDSDDSETNTPSDDEEDEPEAEEDKDSIENTEDVVSEDLTDLKHNGQIMKLTKEELVMMASKGFDYTQKAQDLSNKRRTLDIIDGIDDDILQSVKDAKNGNKEAIAKLVRDFGVDPYDIDVENTAYKPVIDNKNYELDDVINRINQDTDNATVLNGWVKSIPKKSQDFLASNPAILNELYQHTVNGVSQRVMPEVMKQMALNPSLDFMGTYNQIHATLQPEQPREEVAPTKPQASRELKKKATISKAKSNSKINDHKDVWEDDELYAKMQKMRQR